MDLARKVGTRLNTAIERKGWTAGRFLEEMKKTGVKGANPPSILSYRNLTVVPRLEFLLAAALVLEVREQWLVLGEGPMTLEEVTSDEARGGLKIKITERVVEALEEEFPLYSRTDQVSRSAIWDVWACIRRASSPPPKPSKKAWEASAVVAARTLGRVLNAPLMDRDLAHVEPYEFNSFVLSVARSALHLLPRQVVRECYAKPVLADLAEPVRTLTP